MGKLRQCIDKCHRMAAAAALAGKAFDNEGCESMDPNKSCRAKYDLKATRLLASGRCPGCLDAAHQAALADEAAADLRSSNGGFYCAGSVPLTP